MRNFFIARLFVLMSLAVCARGAEPIESITQTARLLSTRAVPEFAGFPAETRALLQQMKRQSRQVLAAAANEHLREIATPEAFRSVLMAEFKRLGALPASAHAFGAIRDVQVKPVAGAKDALLVIVSLDVGCGRDSSTYVLRRADQGWDFSLILENSGYRAAEEAFATADSLAFVDSTGALYAVTADVSQACETKWRDLKLRMVSTSATPESPVILLNHKDRIFAEAFAPRLRQSGVGFVFEFAGDSPIDGLAQLRVRIFKYVVEEGTLRRLAPVALRPHDFVDEWSRMKWEEAVRWIKPFRQPTSELAAFHRRLAREAGAIRIVNPCGEGKPFQWQVGLSIPGSPTLFFSIVQEGEFGFYMAAAGDTRPPGCPGSSFARFNPFPSVILNVPMIHRAPPKPDLEILRPPPTRELN